MTYPLYVRLNLLFSMTLPPSPTLLACTGIVLCAGGGAGARGEVESRVERQKQGGLERGDRKPPYLPILFPPSSQLGFPRPPNGLFDVHLNNIRLIVLSGLLVLYRTSTNSPGLTNAPKDPPWTPRRSAPSGNKAVGCLALVFRRSFSTERAVYYL